MASKDKDISILLVDDSALVLKYATRVLQRLNVPLHTVENGFDALDFMRKNPAELIITDIMMPEMSGFELISQIRSDERFRQTYIIVMTSLDDTSDKVKALDLGANDYTIKPLDANELIARVQAGRREIRLKRDLTDALKSLDYEMKLVADLQQRLLPKKLPRADNFRAAVRYDPCSRAGGDYYDCFLLPSGSLLVTVADVSGHGASAAVLMGMFRALLKVFARDADSAADLVGRLNEALLENIGDDPDFVSAFIGLVDPHTGCLNYSAAGHGDMILIGPRKGQLQRLDVSGTVLGCFTGLWEEAFLDLSAGQSLVLYTDGLTEAVNENNEEFGRDRMEELLMNIENDLGPEEIITAIMEAVEAFTGSHDFSDDVTLLVSRFG